MDGPLPTRTGQHGDRILSTKKKHSVSSGGFKFINLSHPEDVRQSEDAQREIRRHVMRDIAQQRRRPRSKRSPRQTEKDGSEQQGGKDFPPAEDGSLSIGSPRRALVSLGSLPIETSTRVQELLYFNNASGDIYQPLRKAWFEIAMTDPGALHVTLGNTATFLANLRGDFDSMKIPEIMGHYSSSVVLLRNRLTSATESVKPGTVANVLAHVCLSIRYGDWDGYVAHVNGLNSLSTLRGGFADLEPRVLTMILFYDLTGAIIFDSIPRFPLPSGTSAGQRRPMRGVSYRLLELLLQMERMTPAMSIAVEALQLVSSVVDVINMNSHSPSFWIEDINAINLLGPCIHYLLSIPRLPNDFAISPKESNLIMTEILRLVCLLVMSRIKARFGFPVFEQATLEAALSHLVAQHASKLEERHWELKIWALITAALLLRHDDRDVYVNEIRRAAIKPYNRNFEGLINIAKDMIWIDFLESPRVEELLLDMWQPAINNFSVMK